MSLEVHVSDLTELVASGLAVTACGEDLAAGHAAADGRIDAAAAGWRGQCRRRTGGTGRPVGSEHRSVAGPAA